MGNRQNKLSVRDMIHEVVHKSRLIHMVIDDVNVENEKISESIDNPFEVRVDGVYLYDKMIYCLLIEYCRIIGYRVYKKDVENIVSALYESKMHVKLAKKISDNGVIRFNITYNGRGKNCIVFNYKIYIDDWFVINEKVRVNTK